MSKLKKLLTKQAQLTEEVSVTAAFVDRVHGKGSLTMRATSKDGSSDGITFTPVDLELELKVLAPVTEYLKTIKAKLAKVNRKIAALEELVE